MPVRRASTHVAVRRLLIELATSTAQKSSTLILDNADARRELLRLADHHRVSSLVARRLADLNPPLRIDELDAAVARSCAAHLHALRTVRALDDALTIPFAIVKGPVLAHHWYDNAQLREYGDVDVLVHPADFATALDSLRAAGIQCIATNWHGFRRLEVAEIPMRFEATNIDLHWDLIALGRNRRDFRVRTADMLARGQSISLDGCDVVTLDPVDTLIHLCVNTGLDGARRLRGLVDIDTVVRSGQIDAAALLHRADDLRARQIVIVVLQRVEELLGTPQPAGLTSSTNWWCHLNRLVDRRTRAHPGGRDSVAPGMFVSSTRDRNWDTARALASSLRTTVRRLVGRPASTESGEVLDWLAMPAAETVDIHRVRYLDYVSQEAERTSWVRIRRVATLHAWFGGLQPRSTPFLSAAADRGLGRRRCRADVVVDGDGVVLAGLVRYRWTIGHCTGYPLVLDERAESPLASLVDRSGITDLAGMADDVRFTSKMCRRVVASAAATPASLPVGFIWEDEPSDVRIATRNDLDALTDLIWSHAPHGFQNRWLLRRRLRESIDDLVLVVERGGRPVACGVRDGSTPEYDFWNNGVVEPAHRGEGIAWKMVSAGLAEAARHGRGGLVHVVESNPMHFPVDSVAGTWTYAQLRPPRRIRGEHRARSVLDALLRLQLPGAPETHELQAHRQPGTADDRLTDRRTQDYWRKRTESAK